MTDLKPRVAALRLQGLAYAGVAAQLTKDGTPTTESQARSLMRAYLDDQREQARETLADVRDLELLRLDALGESLYAKAEGGDVRAVEATLKVMERRSRLLGLDRPGAWPTGAAGEPEAPGGVPPQKIDLSRLSEDQLIEWRELLRAARTDTD